MAVTCSFTVILLRCGQEPEPRDDNDGARRPDDGTHGHHVPRGARGAPWAVGRRHMAPGAWMGLA